MDVSGMIRTRMGTSNDHKTAAVRGTLSTTHPVTAKTNQSDMVALRYYIKMSSTHISAPANPNPWRPFRRAGLRPRTDGKKGSGPPKPRREASCRRLHGTEVVTAVSQTIP
jgi:hypothetical protein